MIRVIVVLLGILMLTGACSQFGDTPTPRPPASTPTPTETPTPGPNLEDMSLYCGYKGYEVPNIRFRMEWDHDAYVGSFFLSYDVARTRFQTPPAWIHIGCTAIDQFQDREMDQTWRPSSIDCVVDSPDVLSARHELRLDAVIYPRSDNPEKDVVAYNSAGFYILLDLAYSQLQSRAQFLMEVVCVPSNG